MSGFDALSKLSCSKKMPTQWAFFCLNQAAWPTGGSCESKESGGIELFKKVPWRVFG
jgi:hypothetical protein